MSVYLREKLIDSYYIGISTELKLDIQRAVVTLYRRGIITALDIELLKLYCYGYPIQSLTSIVPNAHQRIVWTLAHLEHEVGLRDSTIIDIGLGRYPHLAVIRSSLEKKLAELSNQL